MSILEELYNGNIDPANRCIRQDSEYDRYNEELCERLEQFVHLLSDEQRTQFAKIEDIVIHLNCLSEKDMFIQGFRTGVRMMQEIIFYHRESFCE